MQNAIDQPLIVDASVLIDYRDTDLAILSLLSEHVQPCYVNRSTLSKAKRITVSYATQHGLQVVTPSIEIAVYAAEQIGKSPLSPDDWETILLAEEKKLICLTNDKGMRDECERRAVRVLWGLEPLKTLVALRVIKPGRALLVADAIHETNPRRVHREIITRFREQISMIVQSQRAERN